MNDKKLLSTWDQFSQRSMKLITLVGVAPKETFPDSCWMHILKQHDWPFHSPSQSFQKFLLTISKRHLAKYPFGLTHEQIPGLVHSWVFPMKTWFSLMYNITRLIGSTRQRKKKIFQVVSLWLKGINCFAFCPFPRIWDLTYLPALFPVYIDYYNVLVSCPFQ